MTIEEEDFVEKKVKEYADSMAPSEPHTGEEQLFFKVSSEEGVVIGRCVVNVYEWGRAVLAQLWVEERYRHHGLGSMLKLEMHVTGISTFSKRTVIQSEAPLKIIQKGMQLTRLNSDYNENIVV